ncbi:hypothetical protein J2S09_002838 [Bacillus fengqiuensis]|nr:hypothetical protein [Bacillus fengqiuensis]
MGYILPIHHEQYTQYANRTVPVKHQYQKLTKVMKPRIEGKLNDPDTPFGSAEERGMKVQKTTSKRTAYTREKVEEMFAQLTGKGRLINEVI